MAKQNRVVTQIRNATRRKFTAEDKIRIVLEGLRGEISISGVGQEGEASHPASITNGPKASWKQGRMA